MHRSVSKYQVGGVECKRVVGTNNGGGGGEFIEMFRFFDCG